MSSSQSSKSHKRTRDGHWSPGVSGNPAGRPVGSRNKSTVFLEELLRSHQEALLQKTIDLALIKENPLALRLCVERLYPALKERRIDLALPEIRDLNQATAALSTILTAIGNGEITPGEGAVLAQIVETQQRLLEAQGAEQSRKELEQQSKKVEVEIEGMLRQACGSNRQEPLGAGPEPASTPPEDLQ